MNTALRQLALAIVATAALGACSDDTGSTEDVLAQDSTLAREVMQANRDSVVTPSDSAITNPAAVASAPTAPASASSPMIEPRSAAAEVPAGAQTAPVARTASTKKAPRRSTRTRSAATQSIATRDRSTARARAQRAAPRTAPSTIASAQPSSTSASTGRSVTSSPETTRMQGSALIPAGSEVVLASDQRVCASMSRVGDQFNVKVAEDVMGPIGVVIPKGSVATAQISAVRNDFDIDITSLTFGGHTYQVGSDATFADVEKVRTKSRKNGRSIAAGAGLGGAVGGVVGRDIKSAVIGAAGGAIAGALASRPTYRTDQCVPEGGRITMRLEEPLKVELSE